MKIKNYSFRRALSLILLLLVAVSSTSYSQRALPEKQVEGAIQLKYKYSAEKPVKYLNNSKVLQTMDINGQSMQANVMSVLGCTVRNTGMDGNNLKLEIKIDTMAQIVDSPNGYSGGPLNDVIGKVFNMILSPQGKETDISEAEKIVFVSQANGQGNAGESFYDFFPDMPAGAIKAGYTWTADDTIKGNNPDISMERVIKSENKFEGMEKFEGKDCAKISSVLSGTLDMKTQTQGMDIKIKGPFTGSGELYFYPAGGYFLRNKINTKMTGTIEISSPEAMTFPIVMDITNDNVAKE